MYIINFDHPPKMGSHSPFGKLTWQWKMDPLKENLFPAKKWTTENLHFSIFQPILARYSDGCRRRLLVGGSPQMVVLVTKGSVTPKRSVKNQ